MLGKWVHIVALAVEFSVPKFISPEEIAPILPYVPEAAISTDQLDILHSMNWNVPREVGAGMVREMLNFWRAANEKYRENADKIDRAFDNIAQENEAQFLTLQEITAMILNISDPSRISNATLWAVHRALVSHELGFKTDHRFHRLSQKFEIMSRREHELALQIRQWVREHQEIVVARMKVASDTAIVGKEDVPVPSVETAESPLDRFARKARQLVSESRKLRPLNTLGNWIGSCSVGFEPALQGPWSDRKIATRSSIIGEFTAEEQKILRFLEMWSARGSFRLASSLDAIGSMIVREIGVYKGRLTRAVGYLLLQELGVLTPWENIVFFNSRLALPGYHYNPKSNLLKSEARASLYKSKFEDRMEHLRKDWKDLEVFCVDETSAKEIDDGFSLEAVEGSQSQFWVHVHVANPTAFISPDHPIALYAAQQTESIYLPEKVYPLLDPAITNERFSLDSNRPVLTFSAKMSEGGEILDINITPSIVHNVKFVTPETLRESMEPEEAAGVQRSSFSVGKNPPPDIIGGLNRELQRSLTKSQIETLRKLQKLGSARRHSLKGFQRSSEVSLRGPGRIAVYWTEPTNPYRRSIRSVLGDPTITLRLEGFNPVPNAHSQKLGAIDMIVENLMILAGEVGALWCAQRGIPIPYKGTGGKSELGRLSEYEQRILLPAAQKYGAPDLLAWRGFIMLLGKSAAAVEPIAHQVLGTQAYAQVTSPLRRYVDMVAHWQIEATIRKEAESGKSAIGTTDSSCLPFPREKLQGMLSHLTLRQSVINTLTNYANWHWICQLMFRAYYCKEIALPETFHMYIVQDGLNESRFPPCHDGIVQEIGFAAKMRMNALTEKPGSVRAGDWWEVKLVEVHKYLLSIDFEPLRLIERGSGNRTI